MAAGGLTRLVGLDWKFGVTAATDEADAVGSSFVQLNLKLQRSDSTREQLQFELSLPQFYSVLRTLEQAQQQLGVSPAGAGDSVR